MTVSTTLPTSEDNITTLLVAQRVQLFVSANSNTKNGLAAQNISSVTTRLVTMRGLSINMAHPRRRINHGLSRVYVHAAPDIMMNFVISGDSGLLKWVQDRSTRTKGVLPRYTWNVKVTDEAGTTTDKRFVAQLESVSFEKPIESQDDPYDITCDLIVMDQTMDNPAFE